MLPFSVQLNKLMTLMARIATGKTHASWTLTRLGRSAGRAGVHSLALHVTLELQVTCLTEQSQIQALI